jgi:hypothetical protein
MPEITPEQFIRIANNFYTKNGLVGDINRIKIDSHLINDVFKQPPLKKYKVAFCSIVLNPPYWQYAKRMIETAKEFLLPGHDVDFLVWSDIPTTPEDVNKVLNTISAEGLTPEQIKENYTILHELSEFVNSHANVFPTEPVEWPMPTLMRYHLFLQQEELLKEYDYIFYCDVDTVLTNHKIRLESFIDEEHDLYLTKDATELNGGSLIIKGTETGRLLNLLILSYKDKLENEQNALCHIYENRLLINGKQPIKVLPHPSINSYSYDLYPECKEYIGRPDLGDWEPGNFLIHFPALGLKDKVAMMQEFKEKIIYE